MQKKRTFKPLLLLIAALILSIPDAALAEFSDVPSDHEHAEAINALEKAGIVKGYGDSTFRPDELISRAEFFKLVFNHAGYKAPERLYENPFEDVPAGTWFAAYVQKALALHLITFNPDFPKFIPTRPVSRIEGLKMILPLEGIPAPLSDDQTEIIFQDVDPNSEDSFYIKAAQKSGIFLLEESPLFFSQRLLTRGESAELLYRAQIFRLVMGDPLEFPARELVESSGASGAAPDLFDNPKFPIFLNVWNKINAESLYRDSLDPDQLVYGAIGGLVESLPDEHALFQTPEDALQLQQSFKGIYEGIGTVIDVFENEFLIINVMKDSPAEKAGLKAGDIVLEVDGENVSNYTIMDLINAIKGPSGSTVTLKIRRDGQTFTYRVDRAEIALDSVVFEGAFEVPGDIGYVAIYQFTYSTGLEFGNLLDQTLANGTRGLILDLRDNPGGVVNSAYDVLDYFIPEGEILVKMKLSGQIHDAVSSGPGDLPDKMPIVVLVNKNTASAAEIVAGALQDHDVALLIGEQTYGKGTVQEINTYLDGSLFKFTIAEWLTPLGTSVEPDGLTPDIIVNRTREDVLGETDSQLERAITELQKMF